MGVGIAGVGHAAPDRVLSNSDLEKIIDTSDEWIISRTGIRERRIADEGHGTSDWAVEASLRAIKQAGIKVEDIDLIVIGTSTPDMPLPSCACLVQNKIGAVNAVAFDIAAACSGFVFALSTAYQYIKCGSVKNALVVGADQISSFIDWEDRSTAILFGDAGGACILKNVEGRGIINFDIGSDGKLWDLIAIPGGGSKLKASIKTIENRDHFLKMNGKEVFKHAVRGMIQSINTVLEKTGTDIAEIKCIVPHQANMRIIDAVSSRLDVDKDKIFINLDRYGNTSAASVIVGLSEAMEKGVIKKGDLVMLTTFGAGLVWGSALVEL